MPVGIGLGVAGAASAYSSRKNAKDAAKASTEAAGVQAEAQDEALAYLREINQLPQELREQALQGLFDYSQNTPQYGTGISQDAIKNWFQNNPNASDAEIAVAMQKNGVTPMQIAAATGKPIAEVNNRFSAQGGSVARGPMSQDQLISQAQGSPLYAAIMGTQRAGEQAILRNASATGGLRGGGTIGNLTDFGQQTANRALLASYADAQATDQYNQSFSQNQANFDRQQSGNEFYRQQGVPLGILSGLAGIQGNEGSIADLISGIGTTQAQGMLGAAQAKQQGNQNMWNNLIGLGGLGISAYGAGLI